MTIPQLETDPTKEGSIRHAMMKEVTEDQDHRNQNIKEKPAEKIRQKI